MRWDRSMFNRSLVFPPGKHAKNYGRSQISMGTLWLFNIATENDPFIVVLPIKNGDFP